MKKPARNEVSRDVQARLGAGERKEAIYNDIKSKYGDAAAERSLAQWAYPADREANKFFNFSLLVMALFFVLITALQIVGRFSAIGTTDLAKGLLTLLVWVYTLNGIKNFNLIGYLLIIVFGLQTIVQSASQLPCTFSPIALFSLALSFASIVLALMQKKRLFPNTSFLMRHKRDAQGNILF